MRLKKLLLVVGVALIPAWYLYRTAADKRVPRLEWNEIFMTEDDRLKTQLQAAKDEAEAANKKADEELARIAAANAPAAQRRQAAEKTRVCIEWAENIEVAHTALIEEQRLWATEVEGLLRSQAGVAIAANPDYVRAFRKFHQEMPPESKMDDQINHVRKAKEDCKALAKENPLSAGLEMQDYYLKEAQEFYDGYLGPLKWGRSGIHALVQLANKQVSSSLEDAILQQRVAEAVSDLKPRPW
jgi:hypothetical protein